MKRPHLESRLPFVFVLVLLALSAGGIVPAQDAVRIMPRTLLSVEDAYPHVAQDGRVVFQSNRTGDTHLFVVQRDGTGLRQLSTGAGQDRTPKWSPDGRQVAFASTRDGNEDVWITNADGSGARNVTRHPAGDSHPSWSPDGKQLVFCSTRGDGENDDIYVINVDGSGLQRLTDNGRNWNTFPSFSPDGSRILFRRLLRQRTGEGASVNSEIIVMNRDGTKVVNLTNNAYFDGWPAWSPDAHRVAFSSNRSDLFQIYVMNADGSNVTQVVESPDSDVRPQWLPEGTGLIFNREHGGNVRMMQVELPSKP